MNDLHEYDFGNPLHESMKLLSNTTQRHATVMPYVHHKRLVGLLTHIKPLLGLSCHKF